MENKFDIMQSLTNEEFESLCNCKTADEWDNLCDEVKNKRGGEYPTEWFFRMNMSGLMSRIFSRWEK